MLLKKITEIEDPQMFGVVSKAGQAAITPTTETTYYFLGIPIRKDIMRGAKGLPQ